MRVALLVLASALIPTAAPAAPAPATITVTLSNYRFDPAQIRLQHGQSYVLHLVNRSGRGHNFVAPDFLAAAGAGRRAIEVPNGSVADVGILAPAPGRYRIKCTHFTHAMRGMMGEIVVE